MIQRIQSLFLFLAFSAGLAAFFFPIAGFWSNTYVVKLWVLGVREATYYEVDWPDTIYLIALLGLTTLMSFVIIFLYRQRLAQLRMIRFNILLNVIFLALIFFYYVPEVEAITQVSADYIGEAGMYLILASIVFLLLASRFITRDEKLVRSADRLR